ncbi:MAG: hypothetical protein RR536_00300 [Anaerovoracaceae bacterium]
MTKKEYGIVLIIQDILFIGTGLGAIYSLPTWAVVLGIVFTVLTLVYRSVKVRWYKAEGMSLALQLVGIIAIVSCLFIVKIPVLSACVLAIVIVAASYMEYRDMKKYMKE